MWRRQTGRRRVEAPDVHGRVIIGEVREEGKERKKGSRGEEMEGDPCLLQYTEALGHKAC